ncbi:MAG: poly-beta-1,6-N-acetyl-D-glucosamine N-deacetylase PgaB [bacterium]
MSRSLKLTAIFFLALVFAAGISIRPPSEQDNRTNNTPAALISSARARGSGKLVPPERPLRAVQVMTFDCDSWSEVNDRLAAFKKAGVMAVILRVFHNKGDTPYKFIKPSADRGVYFRTRHAPVVADVLGPFCELAREHGLKVIAWMTSRYANYGREDKTELRCMAWNFDKKEPVPKKGYCPLLPEAQDAITALYTDLARYPVHGVLIQDDLILKHTEGMNPRARKLYRKATGRKADPRLFYKNVRKSGGRHIVGAYTDEFRKWNKWKSAGLLLLAERIRKAVHKKRPGIPVGLNLYYETATRPEKGLEWFSQDMEACLRSDLDFYALMLYHRQMRKELSLSRQSVFDLIDNSVDKLSKKVDKPQRIWVKLQTVDWSTGARVPAAELSELAGKVIHNKVGLVLVPAPRSLDRDTIRTVYGKAGADRGRE